MRFRIWPYQNGRCGTPARLAAIDTLPTWVTANEIDIAPGKPMLNGDMEASTASSGTSA